VRLIRTDYDVLDFVTHPFHDARMSVVPRATPDSLPIGRETEAARLASLIDDAVAGAKRAAVILGAPGIGKSTLLRWARERAEHRGCITASVRVPSAAGLPPRFPLGELLVGFVSAIDQRDRRVPDRLARVVHALTGSDRTIAYDVSLPQIADALEELGRSGPIAVVMDDYHWAPVEGTDLLIGALRVIETPLCFIASARLRDLNDEATPLPEPTADLWVDHIEVRGLAPVAVAEMAATILGGRLLPSLVDSLYARTFGNPLFVSETLQGWRTSGALVATGGFWGLGDEATLRQPRSLREMIVARLSRLTDDELATATALSVLGREADFEEVSAVSELPAERLVDVLERLVVETIIDVEQHHPPRYRLSHPLYSAALLEEDGAPARAALHGRVYAELNRRVQAGRHISAAELAHHAVRALTAPSDLRAVLSSAAAEAESAGSFTEAAIWYGHLAEDADDPREIATALRGQATAAIPTDPQRAIGLFTYALELHPEPGARAGLLLGRARAHRFAGSPESALEDLEAALPLVDPRESFDIRHAMGALYGMAGRIDEAEQLFRLLAAESEGTPDHCKATGHLGMVALVRGSIVEAARLQEAALERCTDDGYALYLRCNLAWMFALLGRWPAADATIELALAAAVSSGDISVETTLLLTAGRLAAWRGDLARAFDETSRARRLAVRLGNPSDLITATDALATALIENEMASDAAAMLAEVMALDAPDLEWREFSYTYSVLAEACLLSGDLEGARTAVERARSHLEHAQFWKVAVDRVEAAVAIACGDPGGALELIEPWVWDASPLVLEQARVLEETAHALRMLGDRAGAEARSQEAVVVLDRLGAVRKADRLRAWSEQTLHRRPGRPRSSGPGHLTDREQEILRLVVLGHSNQGVAAELFISIGTVKKHLENIMVKAGVSRRTELVPFAMSLGVLVPEDLLKARDASAADRPVRRP
jgi:DNA-binding CsgD family transcriptional regulator